MKQGCGANRNFWFAGLKRAMRVWGIGGLDRDEAQWCPKFWEYTVTASPRIRIAH
jgi:hypothetical protein